VDHDSIGTIDRICESYGVSESMTVRVYFEPAGRMHSTQRYLVNYPPTGFEFVKREKTLPGQKILTSDFFFHRRRRSLEQLLPLNLITGWTMSKLGKIPNANIIYAYNHPVFRPSPWVVFVEWFHVLVGRNIRLFKRYRKVVEDLLYSDHCKGILTWGELARQSIIKNYPSGLESKLTVLPLSVNPKNFVKEYDKKKVRLLFVGSPDAGVDFVHKGGVEVLEAFRSLQKEFDNIELVIRANVPLEIKAKFHGMQNVVIIERILPRPALEDLFKSADIFVQPTYDTPFGAFLEAMSYELPVVTRMAFANSEIVDDGKTGLIAKGQRTIDFLYNYDGWVMVPVGATPYRSSFEKAIRVTDPFFVQDLTEKLARLIENQSLRKEMGKKARHEIENGKFSITKRNEILRQVLERA
jgi:glycosyltransferase involved in cell wall biosynthesis